MLANLQIKDFLLIDELELDFFNGLTVITGETGSGKSITIDALMLIFGAKASADIIRNGQNQASFSATFQVDNGKILTWLQTKEFLDSSEENTIICRRVIDRNGRSKAYINSLPVTLGVLKELGEMLLDIHTQHASIALLKAENQRVLLDEFAGVSTLVVELGDKYRLVNSLQNKLNSAEEFSQDLLLKQEILSEKIQDLTNLGLQADEWEELQVQQKNLANASLVLQELDFALNLVNGEQSSLADLAATMNSRLDKISEFLPNYAQITQLANSIEAEIGELDHELQLVAHKIEQDPELLAQVDARIDEIYTLARKYRIQPEEILARLAQWKLELANLVQDTDLELIARELLAAKTEYLDLAQQISAKRTKVASELSDKVTKLLHQLAISGEFKVLIQASEQWSLVGIDNIQYQVCFNQGMSLQPLTKVASGGELSRVALALYVTLSINNPPEVIVFDEIDVGIGGGVAEVVGTLLKELGVAKQVICITHQPQTACCGDLHLQVSKQTRLGHTQSQINYIQDTQRVSEIARMLGGLNITETTLSHAREMLKL
jgi:DNA repair protein RecN (Recombination protein N)